MLNSLLIVRYVRVDLLVRAAFKVVPVELVVSSIFWYVCARQSSLSLSG